ncbi:hypothetical protein GGR58DRAFT_43569 [Xylaria digitata]|nr:hypothetical protein GGR58DRAFT_43569 [Xylaria digitata]
MSSAMNMNNTDCRASCAPYYFLTWVLLALFLTCVALIVADCVLFFHTGKSCQERAAPKWMLEHARRRRMRGSNAAVAAASRSPVSARIRYSSPRPRPRSPGRGGPGYTPPRQTIRLSARRDTV